MLFPPDETGAEYSRLANVVSIRNRHDKTLAVIAVVSPGNKANEGSMRAFVETANSILESAVNLLVVDLFPPTQRDPNGIHGAIWYDVTGHPIETLPEKPLTVATYATGTATIAFVETLSIGEVLPDMSVFIDYERQVIVPLESTYQTTWRVFPQPLKRLLEAQT